MKDFDLFFWLNEKSNELKEIKYHELYQKYTDFFFERYTIEYKKNQINKDIRKIDNYEKNILGNNEDIIIKINENNERFNQIN